MSVKIRLTRIGKKNKPAFRLVAIDSRKARSGKALEILGYYNPSTSPPAFRYNEERLKYWKACGAQLSLAVEKLIEGKYEFKPYKPKKEEKIESEVGRSEETTKDTSTK